MQAIAFYESLEEFNGLELQSLVIKERELRQSTLMKLEAKAEAQWIAPNLHTNISHKYFRPKVINLISNHHNIAKWSGQQSELIKATLQSNRVDIWESRYVPYLAQSYLNWLVNQQKITYEIDDLAIKWADTQGLSPSHVLHKQYLFDTCCYIANKIYTYKMYENRFMDANLINPLKAIDTMRDHRDNLYQALGKTAKLARNGSFEESRLTDILEKITDMTEEIDHILVNFKSEAFRYLNLDIGYYPTIFFPTNYSEILEGRLVGRKNYAD